MFVFPFERCARNRMPRVMYSTKRGVQSKHSPTCNVGVAYYLLFTQRPICLRRNIRRPVRGASARNIDVSTVLYTIILHYSSCRRSFYRAVKKYRKNTVVIPPPPVFSFRIVLYIFSSMNPSVHVLRPYLSSFVI